MSIMWLLRMIHKCGIVGATLLLLSTQEVSADAANGSSENEGWDSCLFEARRKVAMVYARAQLHWVLRGVWPSELRELTDSNRVAPLQPLDPDLLLDPFSEHGVFLRYRVTDSGPEIASMGPDHRWGGWEPEDPFFAADDIVADRRRASQLVGTYLHATYCLKIISGQLTYPDASLSTAADPGDVVKTRELVVSGVDACKSPKELLARLLQEAQLKFFLYEGRAVLDFSRIGLGPHSWVRSLPADARVDHILGILGELIPDWLSLQFLEPGHVLLSVAESPALSDARLAFFELTQVPPLAVHRDALGADWDVETGATFVISLPETWFAEGAKERLELAVRALSGTDERMVFSIGDSVVITESPNLGVAFFFLDLLPDHIPSREERIATRIEINKRVGH